MISNTREMQQIITLSKPTLPKSFVWQIRDAVDADASALYHYYQSLSEEAPNNTRYRPNLVPSQNDIRQQIRWYSDQMLSKMFVATADNQILGQLTMTNGSSAITLHRVELSINVHSLYRGQGIGSALIKHAMNWAINQPALRRIELMVLTRNTDAQRLYARYGFIYEGYERDAYYIPDENVYADAILMAYYIRN